MAIQENGQPLQLGDFLQIQGSSPAAVIFVRISDKDLSDGRPVCSPYETDTGKVLERVRKRWELSAYIAGWKANPDRSPGLLIGLWGSPQGRLVFASARIDRSRWSEAKHDDEFPALISLPIIEGPPGEPADVNAFGLRHSSLAYPNVTFGRNRNEHFHIFPPPL